MSLVRYPPVMRPLDPLPSDWADKPIVDLHYETNGSERETPAGGWSAHGDAQVIYNPRFAPTDDASFDEAIEIAAARARTSPRQQAQAVLQAQEGRYFVTALRGPDLELLSVDAEAMPAGTTVRAVPRLAAVHAVVGASTVIDLRGAPILEGAPG